LTISADELSQEPDLETVEGERDSSLGLRQHSPRMARTARGTLLLLPSKRIRRDNYRACVRTARDSSFVESGLNCERHGAECPKGSDYAPICASCEFRDSIIERSIFHGHYDCGSRESQSNLSTVPQGAFLFGRGACDMKGGIVAISMPFAHSRNWRGIDVRIRLTLVSQRRNWRRGRVAAWLAREGLLGRNGVGQSAGVSPTRRVHLECEAAGVSMRVQVFGSTHTSFLQHCCGNAVERMHLVVASAPGAETRSGS